MRYFSDSLRFLEIFNQIQTVWMGKGGGYSRPGGSEGADFRQLGLEVARVALVGPQPARRWHRRLVPTEVLVLSHSFPCLLMHKALINYNQRAEPAIQISRLGLEVHIKP